MINFFVVVKESMCIGGCGEGLREREREIPSRLLRMDPDVGLDLTTVRPWPKLN